STPTITLLITMITTKSLSSIGELSVIKHIKQYEDDDTLLITTQINKTNYIYLFANRSIVTVDYNFTWPRTIQAGDFLANVNRNEHNEEHIPDIQIVDKDLEGYRCKFDFIDKTVKSEVINMKFDELNQKNE
ncbi:35224_t:CDS:2, partial [Racocetra persica]